MSSNRVPSIFTRFRLVFVGTGVSTALPVMGHCGDECACVYCFCNGADRLSQARRVRNRRNNVSLLINRKSTWNDARAELGLSNVDSDTLSGSLGESETITVQRISNFWESKKELITDFLELVWEHMMDGQSRHARLFEDNKQLQWIASGSFFDITDPASLMRAAIESNEPPSTPNLLPLYNYIQTCLPLRVTISGERGVLQFEVLNSSSVLIDAGKTFRDAYFNVLVPPNKGTALTTAISALLLSHEHMDACGGLDDLRDMQSTIVNSSEQIVRENKRQNILEKARGTKSELQEWSKDQLVGKSTMNIFVYPRDVPSTKCAFNSHAAIASVGARFSTELKETEVNQLLSIYHTCLYPIPTYMSFFCFLSLEAKIGYITQNSRILNRVVDPAMAALCAQIHNGIPQESQNPLYFFLPPSTADEWNFMLDQYKNAPLPLIPRRTTVIDIIVVPDGTVNDPVFVRIDALKALLEGRTITTHCPLPPFSALHIPSLALTGVGTDENTNTVGSTLSFSTWHGGNYVSYGIGLGVHMVAKNSDLINSQVRCTESGTFFSADLFNQSDLEWAERELETKNDAPLSDINVDIDESGPELLNYESDPTILSNISSVLYISDVSGIEEQVLQGLATQLETKVKGANGEIFKSFQIDLLVIDMIAGPGKKNFSHFATDDVFQLLTGWKRGTNCTECTYFRIIPRYVLGVGMYCSLEHFAANKCLLRLLQWYKKEERRQAAQFIKKLFSQGKLRPALEKENRETNMGFQKLPLHRIEYIGLAYDGLTLDLNML